MEPIIVVNDFVFCAKHGGEFCNKCFYDHRMTNNYQLEDKLADIQDILEYDVENRDSFNAYAHGALRVVGKDDSYKCQKHDKIDCNTCFNWLAMIKQQAKDAKAQGAWLKKREKYFRKRDD